MATYYYYKDGLRFETSGSLLKGLAKSGVIEPDTIIEIDGRQHEAQKFKELAAIFEQRPKIGITDERINADVKRIYANADFCSRSGLNIIAGLFVFVFFGLTILISRSCVSPRLLNAVNFIAFVGACATYATVVYAIRFSCESRFNRRKRDYIKQYFPEHKWTILPPPPPKEPKVPARKIFVVCATTAAISITLLFLTIGVSSISHEKAKKTEKLNLGLVARNPNDSEPLNVWLDLETNEVDASPEFYFTSNLPDGMEILASIVKKERADDEGFIAQSSAIVANGKFGFQFFTDSKMENGEYALEITSPIIQTPEINRVIGVSGERLSGPLTRSVVSFGGHRERIVRGKFPFSITDGLVPSNVSQTQDLIESTRSDAQRLYQKLLEFKNNSDFKLYGFAVGGPYNEWLTEVGALRKVLPKGAPQTPQEIERFKVSVAVGELQQLGLEYAHNGGIETETTRHFRNEIESVLN